MASQRIAPLLALALFALSSCGGGGGNGGDPEPQPTPIPAPSAATLVFPANNSECTEGTVINDNQSRVLFQWNASQNTDSYQVNLRNLNTNTTALTNSNTNEVEITLLRGVPYEWFVTSRANGTNETATSASWRFYNAGPGVTNYAPFPPQAVAPARGSTVQATGTLELQWSASDIDNDITGYNVYYGTTQSPPLFAENIPDAFQSVQILSGETYYWQIGAIDGAGNRTLSELFAFQVE